jgi:sugar (pentulose or hexulose) kinase
MPPLLLGIDVGTTYSKAAVVDTGGAALANARVFTPWRRVPTGAEVEPERLVEAALAAARGALGRAPGGRVVAVGVTSMAETGALVDSAGEPVAPAIAWHDERGAHEAAALARDLGEDHFTVTTGLPASPLCTLSKYRWLRATQDGVERGVRWLNVAEWIVRRLGGDELADLSLSSRTGLLELDRRAPWPEALDWAGAPADLLPEPAPSGTAAGRVTRRLDEARGAVLCVAGHDHPCAAVGAGAVREDDLFDSCGTAEAFVRSVPPPLPPERRLQAVAGGVTVGWHAIPERQALLGAFEAGLARQRFGRLLGAEEEDARRALDAEALAVPAGARGVVVQDLNGESAGFEGVSDAGSRAEVWRAMLEALAARGEAVLRTIEDVAGPAARIVVTGGGARNEAALAVKRAALGPFERPPVEEAGARGAALLAGCAAGLFANVGELPAPEPTRIEALS